MKIISELNFMRSAKAPVISAGVMIAKVSWNITNTDSGIVGAMWLTVSCPVSLMYSSPLSSTRSRPPRAAEPGVNARL